MRSVRLLGVSLIAITLLSLASVLLGVVGLDEPACALDTNSYIEDRPGSLIDSDWGPYKVWTSDQREYHPNLKAESQMLSTDIDMDGEDELLFGTHNGSLIVLDVPSGKILINMNFGLGGTNYPYVAAGNLDTDHGREILFFDGLALYCIDFLTQQVQWKSEIKPAIGSDRSHGPISLVDPDGDGVDDVLIRTLERYYRLDNEGRVVHNVSLEVFGGQVFKYPGASTKMIIEDLDDDGNEEVFISDWGIEKHPLIYREGRHVWIIDLASGELEHSNVFNTAAFGSDPLLFTHNGSKYVTIGLTGEYNSSELIIIDVKHWSWEFLDICTTMRMTVSWLSQIPSENDTVLVVGSYNTIVIAWSYQARRTLWSIPGIAAHTESPIVVCDIDNDGEHEILFSPAQVLVLNARTGEVEMDLNINENVTYRGERTAVGDFDGDGYTEVCQGLYFWQREVYEIVYIDTDAIEYSIEISSKDRPLTLYAGLENQVFILMVNMTERRLPSRVDVSMSNDPWNVFGEYQLFPGNGTHGTVMDGLINISTYTIEYFDEGTYLNLSLVPDWNFSHEGPNDLSVSFTSLMGKPYLRTFEDLFVVERDLVFTGDIIISHSEEVLVEGDWLLPSEPLQMSGLDVVYEGTEALHPPRDAFNLDVFDGSEWANISFTDGASLEMDLTSPSVDGEFEIRVRIYQVPIGIHGKGLASFELGVDGTGPHVLGLFPNNTTWFCEPRVPFAILVGDEGCGVDPLSIEYCMVRDLNATQRVWQHVTPDEVSEAELGLRAQSEWSFSEGSTYLMWRFADHLGNGGSADHVVNIDLHGIYFHDFSPLDWVATLVVPVTVTASDRGGSGVNKYSLEYSYSHSDLFSFSEWDSVLSISFPGDPTEVLVKYLGVEGSSNLIRFRGRDNAGNEAISSSVYSVWIDTEYPWVEVVDPYLMYRQDPALRSVRVNVTDWTSGIGGVVAYLHEANGEGTWNLTIELVEGTEHWAVYELSWTDSTLPDLNLEVRVWDNAGNHHGSHHRIVLDRCPSIIEMVPQDGASFENGTIVNFTVVLEDPDGDELSVEWWLGDVLLSDEANFSTSSLPVGEHNISVIVRDRYHEVTGRLGITVTEVPEEPPKVTRETDPWSEWWLVALVVVIVIASTLALHLVRTDEDR